MRDPLYSKQFQQLDSIETENNLIDTRLLRQSMRQVLNTPIQGSAADIVSKAMYNIWINQDLRDLGFKLLLQIHDEVILEGPSIYSEDASGIVKECMENLWEGMEGCVDFPVDIKIRESWGG